MKKKILMIIVMSMLFLNWTINCNNTPDPPRNVNLNVPYHYQQCSYYCGVACIQMWAHFCNGIVYTQDEIADFVYAEPPNGANPYDLADGVAYFTHYEGYIELRNSFEDGAQGDLISATIAGIKEGVPSIMPLGTNHAVLIKGYTWSDVQYVDDEGCVNVKPQAIEVRLHNPDHLPNQSYGVIELEWLFEPSPIFYWVILGYEDYVYEGISGHDAFVTRRGSCYGGPSNYNPKDINIDDNIL